jgi:hypothetical protein
MSEKRIFNVGYIEYPQTTLIYDTLEVDISIYPELEGKTDQEVIEYIKENAWQMKSTDSDVYDSLGEELQDMDLIREKIPHVDSEVWAEVGTNNNTDEEEDNDDE